MDCTLLCGNYAETDPWILCVFLAVCDLVCFSHLRMFCRITAWFLWLRSVMGILQRQTHRNCMLFSAWNLCLKIAFCPMMNWNTSGNYMQADTWTPCDFLCVMFTSFLQWCSSFLVIYFISVSLKSLGKKWWMKSHGIDLIFSMTFLYVFHNIYALLNWIPNYNYMYSPLMLHSG